MSTPDLRERFATHRYAVWPLLVPAQEAARLHAYALARVAAGTLSESASDPALSASGDFIMDGLLADVAPDVERVTGEHVWPTYSYLRVYRCGDVLQRHTDRPSCEISLTVCLGFVPDRTWPIWIEGPRGSSCVELNPGDALLYRGIECPHWRDPFEGDTAAQVFLHYVDRAGPYAEWKFDKRPSLARFPGRVRGM